jgi:hypothetical protein
MPSANRAKLQYEAGQSSVPMAALTDSGDHTVFTGTDAPFSRRDGYDVEVRPNGLITGGQIMPAASGSDDMVDVSAGTAYIGGVLVAFSAATDVEITRGLTADTHAITSITVSNVGAVVAIAGTDGTAHSETRDAEGGPPLIPVNSIELGQVRTSTIAAAVISATEIKTVVGVHQERYDYPMWDVDYFSGQVRFVDALPEIHTGSAIKEVYASYALPVFSDVQIAGDFTAPETSYSVSSEQYYDKTVGSTSQSLSAGSFTALLNDGVTDPLVKLKGEALWFKFFPNRLKSPYIMAQGVLGIVRSFPAGGNISVDCTIAAETEGMEVAS